MTSYIAILAAELIHQSEMLVALYRAASYFGN